MEIELEKQHAALLAASAKHTGKATPLLIACGLVQEGMNLTQVMAEHCQNLKAKIDELEKRSLADKTGAAVQ